MEKSWWPLMTVRSGESLITNVKLTLKDWKDPEFPTLECMREDELTM